jgi:ankyrin repeat protein
MTTNELHTFAYAGNVERVCALLDAGTPLELRDEHGKTPLLLAAFWSAPTVRMLLERGANVHATSDSGWTALHFAAHCHNDAAVELLLAAGLDAAAIDAPDNALARAALESGSRAVVERLQRAGVAFDRVGPDGRTTAEAVLTRLDQGGPRLAYELGLLGPQQVVDGSSVWSRAFERRDVAALVEMVVHRGADPRVRGPDGVSCLHLAIRARDRAAFTTLREHGADLDAVTDAGASVWSQANGTDDPDLISFLAPLFGDRHVAGTRPLDWAWDVGGNGPHVYFAIQTPAGNGPVIEQPTEYSACEVFGEDDTGLVVIRHWGGSDDSHRTEIRRFLDGHRDVSWRVIYGGEGYPPGTIASGTGAATLEAYLNLA